MLEQKGTALPAVECHHPSNVTSLVLVVLTPNILLCCPLAGGRTRDPEQFGPLGTGQISAQLLQPPTTGYSHLLLLACQQHVGTGTIPLPQMWLQLNAENSLTPLQQPQKPAGPFPSIPSAWLWRSVVSRGAAPILLPSHPLLVDAVKPHCSGCCDCAWPCCLVPGCWHQLEALACVGSAPGCSQVISATCGARQEEHGAVAFQPEVTRKQGDQILFFSSWFYIWPSLVLTAVDTNRM